VPPLAEQRRIIAEIEKQFTRVGSALGSLSSAGKRLERATGRILSLTLESLGCSARGPAQFGAFLGPKLDSVQPDPVTCLEILSHS
jgi:hypothetical protein